MGYRPKLFGVGRPEKHVMAGLNLEQLIVPQQVDARAEVCEAARGRACALR